MADACKLIPCSRCGGPALVAESRAIRNRTYYHGRCATDNCAGGPLTVGGEWDSTPDGATELWNHGKQSGELATR
jgi:hypothetical protein